MKVIVDSACDITQDEARELGITVLPLKYYIGEDEYLDGVTVSNHEFYEILEKGDIFPKTTQINPARYMEAFEEATIAKKADLAAVISHDMTHLVMFDTVTSGMLGTFPQWFIEGMAQTSSGDNGWLSNRIHPSSTDSDINNFKSQILSI